MTLDIPLCRTNKGQKSIAFLGPKILKYVKLKHKSSCNYSFFHAQPENKQILEKLQ